MDTNEKKSIGPALGVLIILVVIILGSLYFWEKRTERNNSNTATTTTDQEIEAIQTQSEADDLDSIEADLNATSFEDLDKESVLIEGELKQNNQ